MHDRILPNTDPPPRPGARAGAWLAFAVLLPVAAIVLSPLYWLAAHAVRWAVAG